MFLNEEMDRVPACAPAEKEKLASNLSGLLRQAVRDVQAIERTPGYELNMGVWHTSPGGRDDICYVCMAGAVMARTLGRQKTEKFRAGEDTPEARAMYVINGMRVGNFGAAATVMEVPMTPTRARACVEAMGVVLSRYDSSAEHAPWDVYLEAATILEAAGL